MNELDQFIGTDIWVKVRVKINNRFFYSFARLLSKDTEQVTSNNSNYTYDKIFYRINEVTLSRISQDGVCYCTERFMNYRLNTVFKVSEYDIKLLKPVELITTEELFIVDED